jgi:hypothetical protein
MVHEPTILSEPPDGHILRHGIADFGINPFANRVVDASEGHYCVECLYHVRPTAEPVAGVYELTPWLDQ